MFAKKIRLSSRLPVSTQALFCAGLVVVAWAVSAYFYCSLSHVPLFQLLGLCQLFGGSMGVLLEGRSLRPSVGLRILKGRFLAVVLLISTEVCYVMAFRSAPPAQVDLIHYTWPSLMVVGEAFKNRRSLGAWSYLGVGVCYSGILVLFLPEFLEDGLSLTFLPGYGIALIACLTWVFFCLLGTNPSSSGEKPSMSWEVLSTGLICLVIQSIQGHWLSLSVGEWTTVAFLGLSVYGISFPLWGWALEHGPTKMVGGMANGIPILSVLALVLGGVAHPSPSLAIATCLVAFGCLLMTFSAEQKKPAKYVLKRTLKSG